MISYLFTGLVLPERAQLSLHYAVRFKHITSSISSEAQVSIILNQVAVIIHSEAAWDIFDLRNIVKNLLQNELDIIGYIKGYTYDVDIRRVINPEQNVDYVFGINIPCITERNKSVDLDEKIISIREKTTGAEGILLNRCFNDLISAMKNADDTGFYCYRAIESLRQHCILRFNISKRNKTAQWKKLREIARCDEETIQFIKTAADPVRHGDVMPITSEDRENLFLKTWDIVDNYIDNV